MTSPFDGLTGLLNGVFGGPVTLTPVGGAPVAVRGVFREIPVDDPVGDGRPGLAILPVLRLRAPDAALVGKGALCAVSGRTFRLLRPIPSGSPAADAFVAFELEELP
ncbi:MAG: hypothetical protein ACK4S2_06975 [Gemmobacter sp.]|uniref:head-tail joining protein n=1 Tax=Gemmobacter sp. TaxID=1898957 RepID=UPI003919CC21